MDDARSLLDYADPRGDRLLSRLKRRRRVSAWIVLAAWAATAGAAVFLWFHADDRDPLQAPAALVTVLAGFYAGVSTLAHWAVIVPAVRLREKRVRSGVA